MNIIRDGENYSIYGDGIQVMKKLSAGTFNINFHPMKGFYLTKVTDLKTREDKIYGKNEQYADRILNSYNAFERSLGVLASGAKGTGKTLLLRTISEKAVAQGMPVLIVGNYFEDLSDFLNKIDQEVVLVFDEFEKIYPKVELQNELLGLFDGMTNQKRLFFLTVNEINKLSPYLMNRPGRIHYHIKFGNLDKDSVKTYLFDKVKPEYHNEIKDVIEFSSNNSMSYDILRAITCELNLGNSLRDSLELLNIENNNYITRRVLVKIKGHDKPFLAYGAISLKLDGDYGFSFSTEKCGFYDSENELLFSIIFDKKYISLQSENGSEIDICKYQFIKPYRYELVNEEELDEEDKKFYYILEENSRKYMKKRTLKDLEEKGLPNLYVAQIERVWLVNNEDISN